MGVRAPCQKLPVSRKKVADIIIETLAEAGVRRCYGIYTDLKNPDFVRMADAMGFHGRRVEQAAKLDEAVRDVLSRSGPALLDVKVNRHELVMPPKVEPGQLLHTALYSAKAILAGRGKEVEQLVRSDFAD